RNDRVAVVWELPAGVSVEIYHLPQRTELPVVHEAILQPHVPERRHLESAAVRRIVRDLTPARILRRRAQADVAGCLIGKRWRSGTDIAATWAVEKVQALLLRGCERIWISARGECVKRRLVRDQRSLVCRDRPGDALACDGRITERRGKQGRICRVR